MLSIDEMFVVIKYMIINGRKGDYSVCRVLFIIYSLP